MTLIEFQSKLFSERSVFQRIQFDFVTNLVKWFAIRFAYVLFKLGINANFIDVVGLFVVLFGFILLSSASSGNVILPVIGIILIYFHVFLDFVDGAVAKARGETNMIGHFLDNLGCDVDRIAMLVVIGSLTDNRYIMLINAFVATIFVLFIPKVRKEMPNEGIVGVICRLFFNKHSLLSVRFMLVILPFILAGCILSKTDLAFVSYLISVIYSLLVAVWLVMCIPSYSKETNRIVQGGRL